MGNFAHCRMSTPPPVPAAQHTYQLRTMCHMARDIIAGLENVPHTHTSAAEHTARLEALVGHVTQLKAGAEELFEPPEP